MQAQLVASMDRLGCGSGSGRDKLRHLGHGYTGDQESFGSQVQQQCNWFTRKFGLYGVSCTLGTLRARTPGTQMAAIYVLSVRN